MSRKIDPKDRAEKAARKAVRETLRGKDLFARAEHYIPIEVPAKDDPIRKDLATINGSRHQRRGVGGEVSQFTDKSNGRTLERRTSWDETTGEKIDQWFLLADSPCSVEPGQKIEERYTVTKKQTTPKPAAAKATTTSKATKQPKQKKENPMSLFGVSICSILRWMGWKQWSLADTRGALAVLVKSGKLKQAPNPTTIYIQLAKGTKDKTGDSAPTIPADEQKILRDARDKATDAERGIKEAKPKKAKVAKTTPKKRTKKAAVPHVDPPELVDLVAAATALVNS